MGARLWCYSPWVSETSQSSCHCHPWAGSCWLFHTVTAVSTIALKYSIADRRHLKNVYASFSQYLHQTFHSCASVYMSSCSLDLLSAHDLHSCLSFFFVTLWKRWGWKFFACLTCVCETCTKSARCLTWCDGLASCMDCAICASATLHLLCNMQQ